MGRCADDGRRHSSVCGVTLLSAMKIVDTCLFWVPAGFRRGHGPQSECDAACARRRDSHALAARRAETLVAHTRRRMPNCGRSSRLKRNRRRPAAAAAAAEPDTICASCGVPVASTAGAWQLVRQQDGGPLHHLLNKGVHLLSPDAIVQGNRWLVRGPEPQQVEAEHAPALAGQARSGVAPMAAGSSETMK